MDTTEKVGAGLAVTVVLGLLILFAVADTGPDVPKYEPPGPDLSNAPKVEVITRGAEVDLAKHLPKEGLTVVEFTADW